MRAGVILTALLVTAALIVVGVLLADRKAEQVSPPGPSPRATVSADQGAGSWALPERTWLDLPEPVPASDLYPMQVTGLDALPPVKLTGCPRPAEVDGENQWKAAIRGQWACVHRAWAPIYEQLGWPVVEPEVHFYQGTGSDSDCGYVSAPAFYCSHGHGSVHFGSEHFQMATDWDLAVNEMVNHEYGHHVQNLAGITSARLALSPASHLERRAELQATCWSAMFTYHNRSLTFSGEHFESWQHRLGTMVVDELHGSREALVHWGTRGLYAETMGQCNSWLAAPDEVA